MPNVLISCEIRPRKRTILKHSQLIDCVDIFRFHPSAWIRTRGLRRSSVYCEKIPGLFSSLHIDTVRVLRWPLRGQFSGFLYFFSRGGGGFMNKAVRHAATHVTSRNGYLSPFSRVLRDFEINRLIIL